MRRSGFRQPVLALSLVLSVAWSALSMRSGGAGIEEVTSAGATLSPTATISPAARRTPTSSRTATATRPTETHTPIGWLTPTPTASATSYPTPTLSEHRAMLPIIVRHHPLTMPVGFELVNQIGGASWAVVVQGSYAYVMVGPRLMVMDVSDPRRPTVLGQTAVLRATSLQAVGAMHIAVQDGYVYVPLDDAGLSIIDVTDGAHPVEVARYEAGGARNVVTAGQYAYLADTELGMHILSISDPPHPRLVALYAVPSGARDVDVADGYAYIAAGLSGLVVVSVADPSQPRFVASFGTRYHAYLVTVAGRTAYVAAGDIEIIDVSDPTRPRQVSTISMLMLHIYDTAYTFVVLGIRAYLCTWVSGLRIIDVSDAAHPQQLSHWGGPTGGPTYDVSVEGSLAFVAGDYGLHVLNVEDPKHPVEVGFHKECVPVQVVMSGDRAYAIGQTGPSYVLDISDPTSVLHLGDCEGRWPLAVAGTIGFMNMAEGVEIVDLSDSTCGTRLAVLPYQASGVVVRGQLAYLLTAPDGQIRIADITDPALPFDVGSASIAWQATQLDVAGDYAYVLHGILLVVDVSIPSWPHTVAEVRDPEAIHHYRTGLLVDRSLVYVLSSDDVGGSRGVLWVLDATDPTHPRTVHRVLLAPAGRDLAVAHPLVYIANWDGLQVIDLGDPDNSLLYDTPGYCQHVTLRGDLVYLADGPAGLLILRPLY